MTPFLGVVWSYLDFVTGFLSFRATTVGASTILSFHHVKHVKIIIKQIIYRNFISLTSTEDSLAVVSGRYLEVGLANRREA